MDRRRKISVQQERPGPTRPGTVALPPFSLRRFGHPSVRTAVTAVALHRSTNPKRTAWRAGRRGAGSAARACCCDARVAARDGSSRRLRSPSSRSAPDGPEACPLLLFAAATASATMSFSLVRVDARGRPRRQWAQTQLVDAAPLLEQKATWRSAAPWRSSTSGLCDGTPKSSGIRRARAEHDPRASGAPNTLAAAQPCSPLRFVCSMFHVERCQSVEARLVPCPSHGSLQHHRGGSGPCRL